MNAGPKNAMRAVTSRVLSRDTVCSDCRLRISAQTTSRRHASAAAAVASEQPSTPPISESASVPPVTQTAPKRAFRLLCSPVVSRPPLLTRELTPFEKSFYLYQKRLNERLALPFQRYFYIAPKTPQEIEWKRQRAARNGAAARDVGPYNAYAEEAWNDEVLVGSKLSEPGDIVEKLYLDAEGKVTRQEGAPEESAEEKKESEGMQNALKERTIERPQPRVTEADQKNDVTSLNRKLDRSLYLLVRNKAGAWKFPEDRLYGRENLHQAAERILIQAGGIDMNTWIIGNHPIGHYMTSYAEPKIAKVSLNRLVPGFKTEGEQMEYGEKAFFMKTRIMAGQLDLAKNELGDQEFAWLAKEEIEPKVDKLYWKAVRNMLTAR